MNPLFFSHYTLLNESGSAITPVFGMPEPIVEVPPAAGYIRALEVVRDASDETFNSLN